MRTPPEVRKRLEDANVWMQFRLYRDELKREGMTSAEAHRKSLYRFDPDPKAAEEHAPKDPGAAKAKHDGTDFSDYPEYAEELEALAGETASEVDQIRWVVRNVENVNVTPADCPDPAAWTLLLNCRRSPSFKDSFLLNVWPKIVPSRAQLEGGNPNEGDGDDQIALLTRIAEAAERAKGVGV